MLFDLTDEQVEFRDAMRALVERRVPAGAVRAAWDDPEPLVTNLWSELAALGALGLVVPEEFGGAGASYIEQVLALEELGRAAAPGPVSETAVVAAVIGRYAGTEIQQRWLPGVSGGSALLSVSLGIRIWSLMVRCPMRYWWPMVTCCIWFPRRASAGPRYLRRIPPDALPGLPSISTRPLY
ncbi:acyl-CoA dehydrogenase family protein [Mycobacterium sp. smrl_JER01]|uniref:acyl-CoA dehydrogenase family protein n=1 Tax=Mycobacterium sp. smrl_JER01 TaxID=3402633 RepID=UPI003ABF3877